MKKRLAAACGAAMLAGAAHAAEVRPVELRFAKSAYADFMFYLLYQNPGEHEAALRAAVPLTGDGLPVLIALPHLALQAQSYAELDQWMAPYRTARRRVEQMAAQPGDKAPRYRILSHVEELPRFEELEQLVHSGAAQFPAFRAVWEKDIAPREEAQIAVWKQQDAACKPMEKLQQMARMRFPHPAITIGAVALHLSGSANTDPASITSGVWKKPNLAWTIGHEGTHLLVDEYAGARWKERPQAAGLIAKIGSEGGQAADVEEALSLLMQVKLAQACGTTAADYSLAAKLKDDGTPKYRIAVGLERDWPAYMASSGPDLVDFMLASARRSLKAD